MAHLPCSKKEGFSAEETDLLTHEVKVHNPFQAHWPLLLLDPPMASPISVLLACKPEEEEAHQFKILFINLLQISFCLSFEMVYFFNYSFVFFKIVLLSHGVTGQIRGVLIAESMET